MQSRNRKLNQILVVTLLVLVAISVGYAALSTTLTIQGNISPGQLAPRFPIYDGVYEVTPLAQLDIVLDTANKIL